MHIVDLPIKDIVPYHNNPRHNNEAVPYVMESIQKFGFTSPIIIDSNHVIICGHTRYKAAKRLKLKTLPCHIVDLPEEKAMELRSVDNKVSEFATWDEDKLLQEHLKLFEEYEVDMSIWGFNTLPEIQEEPREDNPDIEPPEEPTTQLGDLYRLGDHILMCADATNKTNYQTLLSNAKAHLYLTDPPYGINNDERKSSVLRCRHYNDGSNLDSILNDNLQDKDLEDFLYTTFSNTIEYLDDTFSAYIFFPAINHIYFRNALDKAGYRLRQELIWKKNVHVLGRQDYHIDYEPIFYLSRPKSKHTFYGNRKHKTTWTQESINLDDMTPAQMKLLLEEILSNTPQEDKRSATLHFDRPQSNKAHPTMKPVKLLNYLIQNNTKQGDLVLDNFGGSGSTLIACEETGRVCRMMELDPKYCDVIIQRWENYTGNKAEKLQ